MKAHHLLFMFLLWAGSGVDVVLTSCSVLQLGDTVRCKCTADTLQNLDSLEQLLACLSTSELEFHDGVLDLQEEYQMVDAALTQYLPLIPINRLLFRRVEIPGMLLSTFLSILSQTKIIHLDFMEVTLQGMPQPPDTTQPSPITTIFMDQVTMDPSLLQPQMKPLRVWLLSSLRHLALRSVTGGLQLDGSDCNSTLMLVNLPKLDLSQNNLTDDSLINVSRCLSSSSSSQPVTSLRLSVLHLSHNRLHMLQDLCPLLQASPDLVELDLSQNSLNYSAVGSGCFGSTTRGLKRLNLSHTGLRTADEVVPEGVEMLDLSGNQLQEFRNPLVEITELYLSDNQLSLLPDLTRATRLKVLRLDRNRLTSLSGEPSLQLVLERLSSLRAGGNTFTCGCENKETVAMLREYHNKVQDWPHAFLCTGPQQNNSAPQRLDDLDEAKCGQSEGESSSGLRVHGDVVFLVLLVVIAASMAGMGIV